MADTNDKRNTSAILDSLKSQIDGPSGMTVKERETAVTDWLSSKADQAVDIIDVSSLSASAATPGAIDIFFIDHDSRSLIMLLLLTVICG